MSANLRERLQATLGSAYTIQRELGGGGMSRVFVAMDTRLNRPVVVKVLSTELAAAVSGQRFEREIQFAASLQQANIVPLLTAGESDGIPYYTMPFVEGESLRARLATKRPVTLPECVGVLRDIARALSYAHARGVAHRDIKPENILLSHGTAMVTDFGIAKAISAASVSGSGATLTQHGTAIGTPAYMAPEQVAGENNADHRVDVYAFGCVAFELLCGETPFTSESTRELFTAHLTRQARDPREMRHDTPRPLAELVLRCLEKDPAHRPATADDLLRILDSVVTHSGEQAVSTIAISASRPIPGEAPRPSPGAAPLPTPLPVPTRTLSRPLIAVAAIVVIAVIAWFGTAGRRGAASVTGPSIAVMPLANLSGDASNDFFGEGLAEEITGALARAGLYVIGRGSARTLAARGLDAKTVADSLSVTNVLQGTFQRSGNQVRISVSLISGKDGSIQWGSRYDREFRDIFAVQDEIARSVVSELSTTLGAGPAGSYVKRETADAEAHTLYLQGMYLWNRRTGPSIRQAIGLFEQAVRRDSSYARAYAGIALARMALPHYDDASADSLTALGRTAADRALAIDSTLAEAWAARAYAHAVRWENAEAERAFRRALAYDSSFAIARFWNALLLARVRQDKLAANELEAAIRLEPMSFVMQAGRVQFLGHVARRHRAALEEGTRLLALDSTFALAKFTLGGVLILREEFEEAIRILEGAAEVPGVRPLEVRARLAYAFARAGRSAESRALLAELQRPFGARPIPVGTVACTLLALGDQEGALASLEAAVVQHDPWLFNFSPGPFYDALRALPRGRELLERTERP